MNEPIKISTLRLHGIHGLNACLTAARAEAILDGQSIVIVDVENGEVLTRLVEKAEYTLLAAEDIECGLAAMPMKNDHRKPLPFREIHVPKKIGNGKGRLK